MVGIFKQLTQKCAWLHTGVMGLALAVVVGLPMPASAASGYWAQVSTKNSPGMCLTYGNQGDSVFQRGCDTARQSFYVQPIGDGYYSKLQSGPYGGTCLDVFSYSHSNHALVTMWPCINNASNQEWHIGWTPNGFTLQPRHAIFDNWSRGKCLDVFSYSHSWGAQVVQWDCLGGVNQLWGIEVL